MQAKPVASNTIEHANGELAAYQSCRNSLNPPAVQTMTSRTTSTMLCNPTTRPTKQRWQHRVLHCMAQLALLMVPSIGLAAEWTLPLAGNAYRTSPAPSDNGFSRQGPIRWSDSRDVISVYFHLSRPSTVELSIRACSPANASKLNATIGGQTLSFKVSGAEPNVVTIGETTELPSGYTRVDLQADSQDSFHSVEAHHLIVRSDHDDLEVNFVQNNQGNMFYWGRRGPSVHLRYLVPKERTLTYAYSEITVPVSQDPLGTYYMANGFGEGYFGIQVNSPTERRVLFSVWSPFSTDNPREIPEDQRIIALGKGKGVHLGEFGNEGSGGQSYLVYPWKAGRTYRFLTEVIPNGKGETTYTSWFGDAAKDEWLLIASFQRPKTDTHLRGFHSFLESFYPAHGHLERRANYGNVWVRDTGGTWYSCQQAVFSVDATGSGKHRLDFTGGSDENQFFLRNCGFFNETGKPGQTFLRTGDPNSPPTINFDQLPR